MAARLIHRGAAKVIELVAKARHPLSHGAAAEVRPA
jgi:hypothetical protein